MTIPVDQAEHGMHVNTQKAQALGNERLGFRLFQVRHRLEAKALLWRKYRCSIFADVAMLEKLRG